MLHLTAMRHGPEFLILLPFAEFADLEVFFNLGMEVPSEYSGQGERNAIYDFDKVFPGMADSIESRRGPLLKEAIGLANALEWLHDQLKVPGESDLYCAHMDLKPDNILILESSLVPDAEKRATARDIGYRLENIRKVMERGPRCLLPAQADGIIEEGESGRSQTTLRFFDIPEVEQLRRIRTTLRNPVGVEGDPALTVHAAPVSAVRRTLSSDRDFGALDRTSTGPKTWDARESPTNTVASRSDEMALSPEGDFLGILSKNEVRLYKTEQTSGDPYWAKELPPNTTWNHISIASGCAAIWGFVKGKHRGPGKCVMIQGQILSTTLMLC